jgi:hypothetical protein
LTAAITGLLSGAGNDGDPQLRVNCEIIEHLIEFEVCRAAQRISDNRPIERHDQDVIFPAHFAASIQTS